MLLLPPRRCRRRCTPSRWSESRSACSCTRHARPARICTSRRRAVEGRAAPHEGRRRRCSSLRRSAGEVEKQKGRGRLYRELGVSRREPLIERGKSRLAQWRGAAMGDMVLATRSAASRTWYGTVRGAVHCWYCCWAALEHGWSARTISLPRTRGHCAVSDGDWRGHKVQATRYEGLLAAPLARRLR